MLNTSYLYLLTTLTLFCSNAYTWTSPTLCTGGEARYRYEYWHGGDVFPAKNAWKVGHIDDYILTRIRVNATVDFSDCLIAFAEIEYPDLFGSKYIDSHYYEKSVHLHQAYLEYYYNEYTVKAGRQELDYGSRLVIATDCYQNNLFSYDVLRLDYADECNELSAFFGLDHFEDVLKTSETKKPVAGYYYSRCGETWQIDQYLLYREFGRCNRDYVGGRRTRRVTWLGARARYETCNWECEFEFVKQFWDRIGFAAHGVVNYYIDPCLYSQPVLFVAYNVASGSEGFKDSYEPFYAARQVYRRSNVQSSLTNLIEAGGGLKLTPFECQPLRLTLSWWQLWKYDREGPIYSWDSNHTWWKPTSHRPLGHIPSILANYYVDDCGVDLTAYASYYFIGSAIKEFSNTRDTLFFYLSMTKYF